MPIIVSKLWTSFFSFGKANAITIYPFVFVKNRKLRENSILINHESIHLAQALELLILPFYIAYLVEFAIRMLQYRNFQMAYMNISFEREAYMHQFNLSYLKNRKLWSFKNYLIKKA